MARPLPSPEEAAAILARKRTRPAPRPAAPAVRALAPTLKALEARFGKGHDALKAHWREIVGEVLARRTEPVKVIRSKQGGSTLELKVEGPAAALIQHQAGQILQRANLYLGGESLEKLRIVQGPLRPLAATPGPVVTRRRKTPLDAAQEAALAESLKAAPDGSLKEALTRLGREVIRKSGP